MQRIFPLLIVLLLAMTATSQVCVDSNLINPSAICPSIWSPVCGCDGVTYGNDCEAQNYGGVTSWANGPCGTGSTCEANFTFTQAGLNVFFVDASTATGSSVNSWQWDFGNGNSSSLPNPAHVYGNYGTYIVTLTITTSDGCSDIVVDTLYLVDVGCVDTSQIDSSQVCPLIYDPICGCDGVTYDNLCMAIHYGGVTSWTGGVCTLECEANFTAFASQLTVDFTDMSTTTGSPIVSWLWDFGDGNTSTLQNPIHVYPVAGNYTACLTITTADTCFNTYCMTITTTAETCEANFATTVSGLSVDFNDLSTTTGTITAWSWDFGDGNTETLQNPSHTYPLPGTYLVCLTIYTANCSSTICDTITVAGDDCTAAFSVIGVLPGNAGEFEAVFEDNSSGVIDSWNWDFGNGNTSSTTNPTNVYVASGLYLVCLTVSNTSGCADMYCDSLFIAYGPDCVNPGQISQSFGCPEIYEPVCGCDDSTYDNSCYAYNYGGVTSWTDGPCILGIDEEPVQTVNIYPIPAKDELNISLTNTSSKTFVTSITTTGEVAFSTEMLPGENHKKVDVSGLPAGIYHLLIKNESGQMNARKFILLK